MGAATAVETARIITVEQILEGDTLCHCGKDAVLIVDSEPDNEPGAVCFEHAQDWLDMTYGMIRRLFGPKEGAMT